MDLIRNVDVHIEVCISNYSAIMPRTLHSTSYRICDQNTAEQYINFWKSMRELCIKDNMTRNVVYITAIIDEFESKHTSATKNGDQNHEIESVVKTIEAATESLHRLLATNTDSRTNDNALERIILKLAEVNGKQRTS